MSDFSILIILISLGITILRFLSEREFRKNIENIIDDE